jgi:hypothetical protein
MTRRWYIRPLVLLPVLLLLLAWGRSAYHNDRVAFGRKHTCVGIAQGAGILTLQFYSSSNPLMIGPKYYHSTLPQAYFWPPTTTTVWQGLGYVTDRFSDGWMIGICLPFWLLLLPCSALALYTFHLTRHPPRRPSAFPIEPLPTQPINIISFPLQK